MHTQTITPTTQTRLMFGWSMHTQTITPTTHPRLMLLDQCTQILTPPTTHQKIGVCLINNNNTNNTHKIGCFLDQCTQAITPTTHRRMASAWSMHTSNTSTNNTQDLLFAWWWWQAILTQTLNGYVLRIGTSYMLNFETPTPLPPNHFQNSLYLPCLKYGEIRSFFVIKNPLVWSNSAFFLWQIFPTQPHKKMGLKLLQRIFFDITKLRGGKKRNSWGEWGKKTFA